MPLDRRLRAIWPVNAQLIGPARDLYAIARRFPNSRLPANPAHPRS
jgi:hypothetical protein